jgi:TRAP-type mannitol/chloroaromatic compound transport system permease small subunit
VRFLLSLSRGIDDVTTLIGRIAWWLTLVMVLIGVTNVVTRYVGRTVGVALGGTEYIVLQTYAYNLVFLLGAAYVFRNDGHVRVDIIYGSLSRRARAWIDIAGTLAFLVPFSLMGLLLSDRYVATSWRQHEVNLNAGGIPIYPIKTVILVAFALLLAQALSELIKNAAFLAGHPHSRSMHDVPAPADGPAQALFEDAPDPAAGEGR